MFIIPPNPVQPHYKQVKKEAKKRGEVTLLGYRVRNVVQLLEGSNRMAAAIELGLPVTINIPEDDHMIMWHDIDYVKSKYTDDDHHAAVYEVALNIALDDERIGLDYPIYDTKDHPNIRVMEKGKQVN